MTVRVSWYDHAHTILCYQFEGTWKLDDLFTALSTGREMIVAEEHIVDTIFDLRNSTTIPQQMLSSVYSVERDLPANLRYSVAVGMNTFLKMLADMIGKAAPLIMKNFIAVNTLEEALSFLHDLRDTSAE